MTEEQRRKLVRDELIALRASLKEAIDSLEKVGFDTDAAVKKTTWAMGRCRVNLQEIGDDKP